MLSLRRVGWWWGVEAIFLPAGGIMFDVGYEANVVWLIAYDVIVKAWLPDWIRRGSAKHLACMFGHRSFILIDHHAY